MVTFDLSRASIKRSIVEINTFLDSSLDSSICKINQDSLFDFYLESSTKINLTIIYHKYLYYFLSNSLSFQILVELFNNKSLSLNKLSSVLFISNNRCYKLIVQLNKALAFYQLTIQINDNLIEVNGDEQNIRFMYWYLLFHGTQNLNWPLSYVPHNLIKNTFSLYRDRYLLNKPLSTQSSVDFYLAILYVRLNKGNYQPFFKTLSSSILQSLLDVHDITYALKHFPINIPTINNNELEHNERKSFNLIMRFLDSEIDTMEEKIKIGNTFLKKNHPVTIFYKKLNTAFINNYLKKDVENILPLFMYYTVLYHEFSYNYSYSQDDIIKMNPLNHNNLIYETSNFSIDLKNYIYTFVEAYPAFTFSLPKTTLQIIGVLHYSLYISYYKDYLSVFVQYSKTPIGNSFIKGKLRHVFNDESLIFTSCIEHADIIISDSIEYEKKEGNTFFLEDIYNVSLWKELYIFIQELLFELYLYKMCFDLLI